MPKAFHRVPMKAELVDSAAEAAAKEHIATLQLEGASNHTTWNPSHVDTWMHRWSLWTGPQRRRRQSTPRRCRWRALASSPSASRARGAPSAPAAGTTASRWVAVCIRTMFWFKAGSARAHGAKGIQVHPLLGLRQIGAHGGDVIM